MAVKLSREAGGFSVLLKETAWLDPALMAPELASALKLPRSDTVRACRLQRGILFEGASGGQARACVDALEGFEVEAISVPDDEVPLLPKPVNVSLARIEDAGLATPSIKGAGMPSLWAWENLALVAGAILMDPDVQTPGLLDKIDDSGFAAPSDRQNMAARQLDKARKRVFPLRAEIDGGRQNMGDALEAALARKGGVGDREVEGFGKVDTAIDFVFVKPFDRLRITGAGRIAGLERTPSRARNLHVALKDITARAHAATQPGATLALAHGADSGEYVFEDLAQFDHYCRWAYFWRLQRQNEFEALREDESDAESDNADGSGS